MTYFKIMKQKKCMPNPIGKAMDEWTKEDVARMEKEADEEIEANFPSYFNEFQKELYQAAGPDTKINADMARNLSAKLIYEDEVPIEDIFTEILELKPSAEDQYLEDFLSCRL